MGAQNSRVIENVVFPVSELKRGFDLLDPKCVLLGWQPLVWQPYVARQLLRNQNVGAPGCPGNRCVDRNLCSRIRSGEDSRVITTSEVGNYIVRTRTDGFHSR